MILMRVSFKLVVIVRPLLRPVNAAGLLKVLAQVIEWSKYMDNSIVAWYRKDNRSIVWWDPEVAEVAREQERKYNGN